jgi:hypothetical protein
MWACDTCKVTYPAQGAAAAVAAASAAPVAPVAPRARRSLTPKQKILVVAGAVSGVALLGIVMVLFLGGGRGTGKTTPEELVQAAIERATAGDAEGLFALSGVEQIFDSVMDCSEADDSSRAERHGKDWKTELVESQREELTRHIDKWKGLTITVSSVEPDGDPDVQHAGSSVGGCKAKTDVTEQHFRAQVKVKGKDGDESDAELRFRAAQVNGLWYLDDMPSAPAGGLGKLRRIKDAMCACKDRTCAEAAQKQLEDFGKDMADSGATSSDDSEEQRTIINELTDCEVKAMSGNPY